MATAGNQGNEVLMRVLKLTVLVLCGLAAGCSQFWDVVTFVKPEGAPSNSQIYSMYEQTVLEQSTSADVLMLFGRPDYALLSQSKSIIALAGEKKKSLAQQHLSLLSLKGAG